MGGAEHVARMGRAEVHTGFRWRNLRERDNVEDLGFDERIILKWILQARDEQARTGSIGLSMKTGGGFL